MPIAENDIFEVENPNQKFHPFRLECLASALELSLCHVQFCGLPNNVYEKPL
jgi:hypothetical protein